MKYISVIKNEVFENIDIVKIYNPLQGVMCAFDVSQWNKHFDYLKYLCKIRNVKYIEPSNTIKKPIVVDKHNPYFNDMKVINELNNSYQNNNQKKNIVLDDKINEQNKLIKLIDHVTDYENEYFKLVEVNNNLFKLQKEMKNYVYDIEILNEITNNKNLIPAYIVLDTETNGLPRNKLIVDSEKYLHAYDTARLLQLSWACYDINGKLIKLSDYYVKPEGYEVRETRIHGITPEIANTGKSFMEVMIKFYNDFTTVKYIVGHNISFDVNVMKSEMMRRSLISMMNDFNKCIPVCTMKKCKTLVGAVSVKGRLKYPKQSELYEFVMKEKMTNAHNSKYDVLNLGKVISKLIQTGKFEF
jgi:DNA polymerase III epsilon subunit-like protein